MAFTELLNKRFMESAKFHQQMKESVNVQQIMKELNEKGLSELSQVYVYK